MVFAAGNGTFVAAGAYGSLHRSADGQSWTSLNSGTNKALRDVAYNGSLFVSVGEKGTVQTSQDGINWTIRSSGTTKNLMAVKYLNGGFIAVGQNGEIIKSQDGINWTKQSLGLDRPLLDVAYGYGKYVAVGGTFNQYNPVVVTSTDGDTWTTADHGSMIPFMAVAYGNGVFVALGQNGQAYRSSDGVTWTYGDLPDSGTYPQAIIYAGGKFMAVCSYSKVFISDDGVNWIRVYADASQNSHFNSIAYGGGNFVAVGNNGKIFASFDGGANWSEQPSGLTITPSGDNDGYLYGITAGSANFVAVGTSGVTLQSSGFGTPPNLDADAVEADKNALTWNSIKGANSAVNNVMFNLVNPLPTAGTNGASISWSAAPTGWVNTSTGAVTRPSSSQGDKQVTLTATISRGTASDTKTFILTVKAQLDPDAQAVAEAKADPGLQRDRSSQYSGRQYHIQPGIWSQPWVTEPPSAGPAACRSILQPTVR